MRLASAHIVPHVLFNHRDPTKQAEELGMGGSGLMSMFSPQPYEWQQPNGIRPSWGAIVAAPSKGAELGCKCPPSGAESKDKTLLKSRWSN